MKHSWPKSRRGTFWNRSTFLICLEKTKDLVLPNLHFRRPNHPAAVSAFQATKAVQSVIFFFTQTPFSWWWSFPLFVDGKTFHAAVYLHIVKDPSVQRKQTYMYSSDQRAQSLLRMEDIPCNYELGNALWLNNTVQMWHAQSVPGRKANRQASETLNMLFYNSTQHLSSENSPTHHRSTKIFLETN